MQIRKFFGLIRKSQIRKFLHNTTQLSLKTALKVVCLQDVLLCTDFY
jgi:hypothetical protein